VQLVCHNNDQERAPKSLMWRSVMRALSRQLYQVRIEGRGSQCVMPRDGILPLRGSVGSEDPKGGSGDEVG
jgi:hypothetical protein